MPNVMDLSGRVAVVVGGTSGLGRAIAIGLAQAGSDVVPTGRREEQIEEVCSEIEKTGVRTMRHASDVRNRGSLDQLRDGIVRQLGAVDILVNAAGTTFRKPTMDVSEEQWNALMDTNLTG